MSDVGGYGRFGALSRQELERYCYLDDEDLRLMAARRRDYNRLGFAIQVVTARHLGMFLVDPLDVPPVLTGYLAEQLGIADPSGVRRYTDRRETRFEHAREIQQKYRLTPFTGVEAELTTWIVDQAWMTGDGPKAIFGDAVAWLRGRQALLPGITTLERLITDGRATADARLWKQLVDQLTPQSADALLALLEVPQDSRQRVSELDRLRKGVFRPSWKGMLAALRRVADLQAVGMNNVDVKAIPPRRLTALATYGLASKAGDAELDGHRLEELAGKFSTVRPFLPMLMETVEFGATADGAAVLKAMKNLAGLLTANPTAKTALTLLDARKVDHDLITGAWKRLVYTPGRPEGTVDCAAYTFCLLEQFHRHLKHRSIFAVCSARWRDPRAHLLDGEAWEKARDAGMNALGLPAEPSALLADHAAALPEVWVNASVKPGCHDITSITTTRPASRTSGCRSRPYCARTP